MQDIKSKLYSFMSKSLFFVSFEIMTACSSPCVLRIKLHAQPTKLFKMSSKSPPFTRHELDQLHLRAVDEAVGWDAHQHQRIANLTRCKPIEYYDRVEKMGVESPYAHYHTAPSGHPQSVINERRIHSLFFHAVRPREGASPFGNRIMSVRPEYLIDSSVFNWYFADFYCSKAQCQRHEVTIVVAKKDSDVDRRLRCQYHLPLLNPQGDKVFLFCVAPTQISTVQPMDSSEHGQHVQFEHSTQAACRTCLHRRRSSR